MHSLNLGTQQVCKVPGDNLKLTHGYLSVDGDYHGKYSMFRVGILTMNRSESTGESMNNLKFYTCALYIV